MPFSKTGETQLVVGTLNVPVVRGNMPPGEIKLWDANPRIAHLTAGRGQVLGDEDLISLIEDVQRSAFATLMRDIMRYGQQEPVFIRSLDRGQQIEAAIVLEGNTRVSILKRLHKDFPDNPRYATVLCYLLPQGFSETDLAILMANYHVKGNLRNQWDRYQIGAFLHEHIVVKQHFTQQEIAQQLSKSPSWVSQLLAAYRFALEYKDQLQGSYQVDEADAEADLNKKFSILEEAWKVKRFRDKLEDPHSDAKETVFRWVHEGKFTDHRKIRKIDDIYSNRAFKERVDDGTFGAGDVAADRLERANPLHQAIDSLIDRLETITIGDLGSIDKARVNRVVAALDNLQEMLTRLKAPAG
jgi:hypothetical protein